MNGFAFGGPIQPFLQIGKELGRLGLLAGLNQGKQLFLRGARGLQQNPVEFATTYRGASLFGGGSCVCHKGQICRNPGSSVNP